MTRTKSWLWFIRHPWAVWVYVLVMSTLNAYSLYRGPNNVLSWAGLALVTIVVAIVLIDRRYDQRGRRGELDK